MRALAAALACAAALMFASLALSLAPAPALASSSPPAMSVPSGLLMTVDGHILWERRPQQTRHVASCIKMLNALVARDKADLDDVITVTAKSQIANGGVRLRAGQKLTVRQLLNIMLIHSANDAAMALAIGIGGTESNYVAMMNAKAKSLGLAQTHAIDPNGLSGKETSSAKDLATLGQHILADPVLRNIVDQVSVPVPRVNGPSQTYPSSDLLLGHYVGLEGIKTGFTNDAGWCYVGAAKRANVELIGVVLGAPTERLRFSYMAKLLDWGFVNTTVRKVVSADESHLAVVDGRNETLYAANAASAVVYAGGGPLVRRVTTAGAQSSADGRTATLVVSQDGFTLARVGLFSRKGARAGWGRTLTWLLIALAVAGVAFAAWWFADSARRDARARGRHAAPRGSGSGPGAGVRGGQRPAASGPAARAAAQRQSHRSPTPPEWPTPEPHRGERGPAAASARGADPARATRGEPSHVHAHPRRHISDRIADSRAARAMEEARADGGPPPPPGRDPRWEGRDVAPSEWQRDSREGHEPQ